VEQATEVELVQADAGLREVEASPEEEEEKEEKEEKEEEEEARGQPEAEVPEEGGDFAAEVDGDAKRSDTPDCLEADDSRAEEDWQEAEDSQDVAAEEDSEQEKEGRSSIGGRWSRRDHVDDDTEEPEAEETEADAENGITAAEEATPSDQPSAEVAPENDSHEEEEEDDRGLNQGTAGKVASDVASSKPVVATHRGEGFA